MERSKVETLEAEAGHLIRHIGHFYRVGHSNYTRATSWAQVCYYGEGFIKAIDAFLAEERQNARRGARNTIKEPPGERVTNELLPF